MTIHVLEHYLKAQKAYSHASDNQNHLLEEMEKLTAALPVTSPGEAYAKLELALERLDALRYEIEARDLEFLEHCIQTAQVFLKKNSQLKTE